MKKIALMVAGALALGAGLAAAPAQAGGFGFSVGFGAPVYAPYYRPYPASIVPTPSYAGSLPSPDRPIIIGHAWSIAGLFTTGPPVPAPALFRPPRRLSDRVLPTPAVLREADRL